MSLNFARIDREKCSLSLVKFFDSFSFARNFALLFGDKLKIQY